MGDTAPRYAQLMPLEGAQPEISGSNRALAHLPFIPAFLTWEGQVSNAMSQQGWMFALQGWELLPLVQAG